MLLILGFSPGYAHAQEDSSIEINTDTLDTLDDYQPPPMFGGDAQAPVRGGARMLTGLGEEPPSQPQQQEESRNPFDYFSQPEEKIISKAPIPPCRPAVLDKPTIILEGRRDTGVTPPAKTKVAVKPVGKPQKPKISKTVPTKIEANDLVETTAEDILASIEGKKRPKKAEKTPLGKPLPPVSMNYAPGETVLTLNMKKELLNVSIPAYRENPKARLEIRAYSSVGELGETGARRISLARALEMRDFLIASGIDPSRIDVRPLGNAGASGEADKVEIVPAKTGG